MNATAFQRDWTLGTVFWNLDISNGLLRELDLGVRFFRVLGLGFGVRLRALNIYFRFYGDPDRWVWFFCCLLLTRQRCDGKRPFANYLEGGDGMFGDKLKWR